MTTCDVYCELGELVNGTKAGRENDHELIVSDTDCHTVPMYHLQVIFRTLYHFPHHIPVSFASHQL